MHNQPTDRELKIKEAVAKKFQKAGYLNEIEELTGEKLTVDHTDINLSKFISQDSRVIEIKKQIVKLAPEKLPVLIIGETGTGKELLANALHGNREGEFVAVNTAGIPDTLLEAEFFGAKRGAYTGCDHDRLGYLREAHNGTLFLDEIGDMPLLLQCKLLRVLQEHRARPLGDEKEYAVTCRFISATNKPLDALKQSSMRSDLLYRLMGFKIEIPPLRERHEDIRLICDRFIFTPEGGWYNSGFSNRDWPGNVRELLNLIEVERIMSK